MIVRLIFFFPSIIVYELCLWQGKLQFCFLVFFFCFLQKPKNWRLACQTTVGKPDSTGVVRDSWLLSFSTTYLSLIGLKGNGFVLILCNWTIYWFFIIIPFDVGCSSTTTGVERAWMEIWKASRVRFFIAKRREYQ